MNNTADKKKVGFLLERAFRITKLSFIQVFKDLDVDITPDQWVILDALYYSGEMTQKALVECSFKDAPTVSRIIDKMVNKNYVFRVNGKDDRRKTLVSISKDGKFLVEKCSPLIESLREHSWQGLTDEDYRDFKRIMSTIYKNLNNEN